MAISQLKPLFLLVLVSLFFFPTLGAFFETCDPPHLYPIKISVADFSPDPVNDDRNVNFMVTGNTSIFLESVMMVFSGIDRIITQSKVISGDGATVRLEIRATMDRSVSPHLLHYSLCNVTSCPIARGPFKLTFSTVIPTDIFNRSLDALATVSITEKPDAEKHMICIKFIVRMHDYSSQAIG